MVQEELIMELRKPRSDEAQLEVFKALLAGLKPDDCLQEMVEDCIMIIEDCLDTARWLEAMEEIKAHRRDAPFEEEDARRREFWEDRERLERRL